MPVQRKVIMEEDATVSTRLVDLHIHSNSEHSKNNNHHNYCAKNGEHCNHKSYCVSSRHNTWVEKIRNIKCWPLSALFNCISPDESVVYVDQQVVQCKPDSLDALTRSTRFSRHELKILYRGFKQDCPYGVVDEATFSEIYSQFFPHGDCTLYAHHVFKTLDKNNNGFITFEEFVASLSVLARGSQADKLAWTFRLYDRDGDGMISRGELEDVMMGVYDMVGAHTNPPVLAGTVTDHVNKIFQKLDRNHDGVISQQQFMEVCQQDENIMRSLTLFDTNL